MSNDSNDIKGRGAGFNPDNRYENLQIRMDPVEANDEQNLEGIERPLLRTQFFSDASKSIVAENDSPDIPFTYSVNPYRGCEHGCAYCYARPTHEYLGFSAGLDFESKIVVKQDAAELLRKKLMSRSWKGEQITFSGNTDCYQPIERKLQITRRCLEVMLDFRNPVWIITKNALVTRDIDILQPLAALGAAGVTVSITSLDDRLCADLEPRTSRPKSRLETVRKLSEAGIPVSVNVAPVIPGLNDIEVPAILKAAREAGARDAAMTLIRLPLAVAPIFENWLMRNRPERASKVLNLIRDMRGGKLNDPNFGSRFKGQGAVAANLKNMFKIFRKQAGFDDVERIRVTSEHFTRPGDQLSLL